MCAHEPDAGRRKPTDAAVVDGRRTPGRSPDRSPDPRNSAPRVDSVARKLGETQQFGSPLTKVANGTSEPVETPADLVRYFRIDVPRFQPETPAAENGELARGNLTVEIVHRKTQPHEEVGRVLVGEVDPRVAVRRDAVANRERDAHGARSDRGGTLARLALGRSRGVLALGSSLPLALGSSLSLTLRARKSDATTVISWITSASVSSLARRGQFLHPKLGNWTRTGRGRRAPRRKAARTDGMTAVLSLAGRLPQTPHPQQDRRSLTTEAGRTRQRTAPGSGLT